MKLTKEDYMRLPKERLAELLAEMDNVEIPPSIPNDDPWRRYPYGPPVITYTDKVPRSKYRSSTPGFNT